MTENVAKQIQEVRQSGKTNMFDIRAVQHIAFEMGLHELVLYLTTEDQSEYARYILGGKKNE